MRSFTKRICDITSHNAIRYLLLSPLKLAMNFIPLAPKRNIAQGFTLRLHRSVTHCLSSTQTHPTFSGLPIPIWKICTFLSKPPSCLLQILPVSDSRYRIEMADHALVLLRSVYKRLTMDVCHHSWCDVCFPLSRPCCYQQSRQGDWSASQHRSVLWERFPWREDLIRLETLNKENTLSEKAVHFLFSVCTVNPHPSLPPSEFGFIL